MTMHIPANDHGALYVLEITGTLPDGLTEKTDAALLAVLGPVVVNTDAYDMLSDDERAALDSSVDEAIAYYLENYGKLLTKWDEVLAEKGVEKVMISDDQLAAFRAKAADPIREEWIKEMEGQGIPGQELYDLVVKTLADTRASN